MTRGTVPLNRVLAEVLKIFDSLAASSPLVDAALRSYRLMTLVIEPGEKLEVGADHPGKGMANFKAEEATFYIAVGRAMDQDVGPLTLGIGEHNVGTDFHTVLSHEIGHLVMPSLEEASGEVVAIIFDDHPVEYWESKISTYAGSDSKEMFAEAFAAYVHPQYAGGLPADIERVFTEAGITAATRKLAKADPKKKPKQTDPVTTASGITVTAAEINAILDLVDDADWFTVEGTLSAAMLKMFKDAGYDEIARLEFNMGEENMAVGRADLLDVLDKEAVSYAKDHAAELVTNVTDSTRDMLRGTINDALTEGWSKKELTTELSNNYAFSESRAEMIAHTELAMAHSYGRVDVAKEAGATKKKWLLSADHDPDEDCFCSDAADQEWIDIDDNFADDDDYDFPPGHPRCQCDWTSNLNGEDDDEEEDDTEKMAKVDDSVLRAIVSHGNEIAEARRRDAESLGQLWPDQFSKEKERLKIEQEFERMTKTKVDSAAHEAATSPRNDLPEPTDKQKSAENYKHGHITVGEIDIAIENPVGSRRKPHFPKMTAHYGRIKGTHGMDGEELDVFVREGTDDGYQGPVYIVDQVRKDGSPDEHKIMIGWNSRQAAVAAYRSNYTPDFVVGPVTRMSWQQFKEWLSGDTTKPISHSTV